MGMRHAANELFNQLLTCRQQRLKGDIIDGHAIKVPLQLSRDIFGT